MRKHRAADDIVVAVNGVDADQHRDRDLDAFRVDRGVVITVGHGDPFRDGRILLAARRRVAAAQHRAEPVFFDVGGRHRAVVGLNDLTDFLFDAHGRHDLVDARLDPGIDERRRRVCRRPARNVARRIRRGRRARGRLAAAAPAAGDKRRRRRASEKNRG